MKNLKDFERVLIFLYAVDHPEGHPKWSQVELLAKMMNWRKERAEAAFKKTVQCGYAERLAS